jgi:hypothetical protein
MGTTSPPLLERLEALGLKCDCISLDQVSSATAALACFPMYMVANAHLWAEDGPPRGRLLSLPGAEEILESFEIGRQESSWDISTEHRQVLAALLRSPKPSDRATYEYALETLKELLAVAGPQLAETLRNGVARMIVAVAHASGEGLLGTGERISPEERACIRRIATELVLDKEEAAAWLLEQLGE